MAPCEAEGVTDLERRTRHLTVCEVHQIAAAGEIVFGDLSLARLQ